MKCPYCEKEMQNGTISGDGRSGVYFNEGTNRVSMMDKLVGKGKVLAVNYGLATFTVEANYCPSCKKLIIDTEISG